MRFNVLKTLNSYMLCETFQKLKLPKKDLYQLNMSKDITISQQSSKLTDKVVTNDVVYIPTPKEKSNYLPSYRYAQIAHEDNDLAIMAKPRGVKIHPNDLKESNTLTSHVIHTMDSNYVGLIHCLDQETMGLLIVARSPLMKKVPDRVLKENQITCTYCANVKALLFLEPQTIDMLIGKDRFHPGKRRISNIGQRVIIHTLTPRMTKEGICQSEIELDTGHTHQICIYPVEIGHPVIDDPLYGDAILRQLGLNSYKIEFTHPLTQELISVSLDDE